MLTHYASCMSPPRAPHLPYTRFSLCLSPSFPSCVISFFVPLLTVTTPHFSILIVYHHPDSLSSAFAIILHIRAGVLDIVAARTSHYVQQAMRMVMEVVGCGVAFAKLLSHLPNHGVNKYGVNRYSTCNHQPQHSPMPHMTGTVQTFRSKYYWGD